MDLTQEAPRPGYLQLGGWIWLPRMIDKARGKYQGNPGNYVHPCGNDMMLLFQLGISAEEFRTIIESTETDEQVLENIEELQKRRSAP